MPAMPSHHPLEALQFNSSSLNELKGSLPLIPIEEEKGAKKAAKTAGDSIGDEAMAHADSQRELVRRATRRNPVTKRGDLGFVDKGPEKLREERTPVDTSAAGIAADLASFAEACAKPPVDTRIEWAPLGGGAPRKITTGWQPFDGRQKTI